MTPAENWVSVERVASHLGVAKESIYRWIASKEFPVHRVGRLFRFKISEVDAWVTNHGDDPSQSGSAQGATNKLKSGKLRRKKPSNGK